MSSYPPRQDQAYNAWLQNFITQLLANVATFGMTSADVDLLAAAQSDFDTAYASHAAAQLAAKAATSHKNKKRDDSDELLRPIVRRINNHPNMTDALRDILGLKPADAGESTVPISELTPSVFLEANIGFVHVHWGPNPQNERQNGKPAGVKSALIYRRIVGEDAFQLIGYATKSPYLDDIAGPAQSYEYMVRYRGTDPRDVSGQSEGAMIAARGELAA